MFLFICMMIGSMVVVNGMLFMNVFVILVMSFISNMVLIWCCSIGKEAMSVESLSAMVLSKSSLVMFLVNINKFVKNNKEFYLIFLSVYLNLLWFFVRSIVIVLKIVTYVGFMCITGCKKNSKMIKIKIVLLWMSKFMLCMGYFVCNLLMLMLIFWLNNVLL